MEEKKKESFNIEEDDNRIICHLNFVGELVTNMTIKKFFLNLPTLSLSDEIYLRKPSKPNITQINFLAP